MTVTEQDDAAAAHELEGGRRPRRLHRWQAAVAVAAVVLLMIGLVAVVADDGDGETKVALRPATGSTTVTTVDVSPTVPTTAVPVTVSPPTTAAVIVPKPVVAPTATTAAPRPATRGVALTSGGLWLAAPSGGGVRQVVSGLVQGFDVSPDGRRLAFGQDGHLWTINADGTGRTRILSNDPGRLVCCGIRWSPKGDLLAFIASDGGPSEALWLVNSDGTNPRKIVDRPASSTPIAFTRDGTRLAFVRAGLDVYNVVTGELQTLWDSPVSPFAAWSGDDSRIVFLGGEMGQMIDVINADGTGHRRLPGTDRIPGFLDWRASSNEILYSDSSAFELWAVGADTGNPHMMMTGVEAATAAPSGDRVALTRRDGFIAGTGEYRAVLEVGSGDLSQRARVAESTTEARLVGARWSADGSVLVLRAITPSR